MSPDPATPSAPSGARALGEREPNWTELDHQIDDRELLTWLIVNHASFGTSSRLAEVRGGAPVWQDSVFVRRPCRYLSEWHCFDGEDARAAIRTAMAAPPCSEDEEHGCSQSCTIRDHGAESPLGLAEKRIASLESALAAASARPDAEATIRKAAHLMATRMEGASIEESYVAGYRVLFAHLYPDQPVPSARPASPPQYEVAMEKDYGTPAQALLIALENGRRVTASPPAPVETTSCPYHGTLHRADVLCPICIAEETDGTDDR